MCLSLGLGREFWDIWSICIHDVRLCQVVAPQQIRLGVDVLQRQLELAERLHGPRFWRGHDIEVAKLEAACAERQ
jgi:hypothetical protein